MLNHMPMKSSKYKPELEFEYDSSLFLKTGCSSISAMDSGIKTANINLKTAIL